MTDMSENAPEIAVVVPVKNEAENIAPLIDEIVAALSGVVAFEILYVDDGSDDRTPAELDAAKARVPQLRVIRHKQSAGQSMAVLTGVRHAKARFVATLDGDGQNDPADIPKLWAAHGEAMRAGEKLMVCGQRAKRQDNAIRLFSSKIANGIRSRMLRDATPDTGCGLKLFAREDFLAFPRFDHMHRFMPALMQRDGGRTVSVHVNHRARERGTSKYGVWNRLWVGIVDLFGVAWLQRRGHTAIVESAD